MTRITPQIRLMTPEETRTSRLINAGSVVELERTTIPISAGRSDQVYVFKESTVVYVLSINYRHEYIGLEIFDAGSGEEFDCIFLQNNWELVESLGAKWKELEPITIVRRLRGFLS